MGKDSDVPQPGPARLAKGAGPDEWLEQAKQCRYLPEADMKRLCEIVKECLMEGKSESWSCCLFTSTFAPPPHPGLVAQVQRLTSPPFRVEHSTCFHACHGMRRYSWSVLRPPRTFPSGWGHAWRHSGSRCDPNTHPERHNAR